MRLRFTLLLALLGTAFLAFTHAALSTPQEPEQQYATSRSAEIHDGLGEQFGARSLRGNDVISSDDEERMGAKEAFGWISNTVKMKAKMKFWLHRGTAPEKVLEKLKVASPADENYKYYSRYFFKFYAKFPDRQPSNLSAKTADEIMKTRMHNWLDTNLTPPQAFKELKLTGTFASARGQPNFKYFEQYSDMWDTAPPQWETERRPSSQSTNLDSLSLGAQSKSAVDKKVLRASEVSANSPYSTNKNEEARDLTASKVIGAAADAIKMKTKLNIMLVRGLKPARVLEKLSVYRVSDKNFNNFARYYAKYLAKYSSKMPDLPKTAEDALIQPKLKEWLAHGLLPAQVEVQLKKIATANVNRYMQLYLKEADNSIILPKLERWMGQKLLPSQFKYNLNEMGIKDTTKYMDWYMRNGGDAVVKAKLRSWLGKKVLPPQIVPKLRKAGLTDIQEYAALYMRMWGKRQAELSRRKVN